MGQQRDEVLAELRRLITHGYFVGGQIFSEADLTSKLGVSRSPIREALAVLAQEGIIDQLHRKGVMVRIIGESETREVLRLRKSIETVVVEELATSTLADRLDGVEEILAEMDDAAEANDVARFLDADTEFHCGLARRAGYSAAADMLQTLRDKVRIVGLDSLQRNSRLKEANLVHRELVSAILENNVDRALLLLNEHLDATARQLLHEVKEGISPEVSEIGKLVDRARRYRREEGRLIKAVDALEQAIDIASKSPDLNHELVQVLLELATTRRSMQDFRTAEKHAKEALRISQRHENRAGMAWAYSELGRIAVDAASVWNDDVEDVPPGDPADLDKASALFQGLPDFNEHRGWNFFHLALRARGRGDLPEAERLAAVARDALAQAHDSYGVAAALWLQGGLAGQRRDPAEAMELLEKAGELARLEGYIPMLANTALEEGRILQHAPDASRKDSVDRLKTALEMYEDMQDAPGMAKARLALEPAL